MKKRRAITPQSIIPRPERRTSMVAAKDMVPETAYRYSKTPAVFYVVLKTLTVAKLKKRLEKKYQKLDGQSVALLFQIRKSDDLILAVAVRRCRIDGQKREIKRYVLLDPDTKMRKLKSFPGWS